MKIKIVLYATASALYILGVWFHYPYGGGHVYSDIVTVFAFRFCGSPSGTCVLGVPYISTFVEYPILVSLFMYSMGVLGSVASNSLQQYTMIYDYYYLTSLFLAIPTFLLIRECVKITEILGLTKKRVLIYVVATPSFVFMLLLNWYVIGVWLSTFALRKYLENRYFTSGLLFGLSAASNLVTAIPMIGSLFLSRDWISRVKMVVMAATVFLAINIPFYLANPGLWMQSWNWIYNWYIEGSWLYAIFWPNLYVPQRHTIPLVLMSIFSIAIVWRYVRDRRKGFERRSEAIKMAWMFTFAYLFSTYILTPQMNIIMLPFFMATPISRRYPEFLAFDALNSLVIVLGYSTTLPYLLGIHYVFQNSGPLTIIPLMAIIRSLWVGKFLIVDGLLFPSKSASAAGLPESAVVVPPSASSSPQHVSTKTIE